MPTLSLTNVSVHYQGQPGPAVARTSLSIDTGEFVVLTGRSGCGKTSLLNLAAGFVEPSTGGAAIDGRPIAGPGADRAVVLQNDALEAGLNPATDPILAEGAKAPTST